MDVTIWWALFSFVLRVVIDNVAKTDCFVCSITLRRCRFKYVLVFNVLCCECMPSAILSMFSFHFLLYM